MQDNKPKSKIQLLIILLFNYFTFMLITAIPGVLLPYWKTEFNLDLASVTWLGAVFFLAYGLTSLPNGILLEKIGSKNTFLYACSLILISSLAFAFSPNFIICLIAWFFVGVGVTALQIVGNLLVKRIDEDPAKYSRNLTMAQAFCGIGAFSGGQLNRLFTQYIPNFEWRIFYFIFAGLIFLLALMVLFTDIPEKNSEEKSQRPSCKDYLNLLSNPVMILFAMGIFIYVGIEVGIGNLISTFFEKYYQLPVAVGGSVAALYWGLQTVGRFTGGIVLNYLNTPKALITYALSALASLIIAVFSPAVIISQIAFVAVGFFTSIMFPSIFSLAVNSFDKKLEDTVAGILCTAIIGGAVTQVLIGYLSIATGLKMSLLILSVISFLYIALIGLKNLNTKIAN